MLDRSESFSHALPQVRDSVGIAVDLRRINVALSAFLSPWTFATGLRRPLPPAAPARRHRATCPTSMSEPGGNKRTRNWAPRIENRIARMRYEFIATYECGIELLGTEIKSVRSGQMNLREGYARVKGGQVYLHNVHITPWESAGQYFNHEALRPRRLLLHKSEIRKLASKQDDPGLTLVPTKAYFTESGFLKVEIALARGKQLHDRREDIKKRENDRELKRIVKTSLGL
jgi:SsrA-binding protein